MKVRRNPNRIAKVAKDVRDMARETLHRSAADAERERRDLAGDTMTTGEKVKSAASEVQQRAQANVDRAKRKVRDA
ncbi:MAG: hypothetical protein JO263_10335 [Candidatus Eremiobacteraeota bacterium]|nr:hypothetical protein [Candidatus Eremiobacteraeota bacterium]